MQNTIKSTFNSLMKNIAEYGEGSPSIWFAYKPQKPQMTKETK